MSLGERRHRNAALLLHGLPEAARLNVLNELDAAERQLLQPLLEELSVLGVPASLARDPRWPLVDVAPLSSRERVAQLSASMVLACTEGASAATVAALMSVSDWPWKEALLALLPETRRREVLNHLWGGAVSVAPGVAEAWCVRLCTQAEARHGSAVRSGRRFGEGLRSLLRWM